MAGQPTWSPARRASSTKAVPGRIGVPLMAWSASQGWAVDRQAAGQDGAAVGLLHRRAQDRMVGGDLAERGRVTGRGGLQPVAAPLEGVGGQVQMADAGRSGTVVQAGQAVQSTPVPHVQAWPSPATS